MEQRFDHTSEEAKLYQRWEASGYFNPDNLPHAQDATPFTIIMPPPNANGSLHAGHALFVTIQDVLTRYWRMRGRRALWVPGADHAGFETQIVYEKKLEKEGRSRFDLSREDLFQEILTFTLENKTFMEGQIRSLGASCDWSRERFTLDSSVIEQTQRTFKKMYDDGLIYRSKRPVNWCTKHQTSLSDVETESVERVDTMYYITYGPFTVATVRPETIFGDVAIAVHPDDQRYQQYIGTTIVVQTPIGSMDLRVIADAFVDREFGTGALKVTPGHSKDDFELAQRHGLPIVEVIDQYGKLNEHTGTYAGMKVAAARAAVAADLAAMGMLTREEPYTHVVPTCYKCATTIEPRILNQWFVRMEPLAQLALTAVQRTEIRFIPERFERIFTYWMEHTLDWNISRQIVWGIPIPAVICDTCGAGMPGSEPATCPQCHAAMRTDTDTFDTWFSSGQWPYLALGYPDGADMATYYPTDVMETGNDLVFKWVPRMVFFSLYLTGQVPFRTVYFHGLVNDAQGKKMSKSKGNVINPLDLTNEYGTDALRMALVVGNPAGSDSALATDKVRGYRNFTTKLWNMARFVLQYQTIAHADPLDTTLQPADEVVLAEARAAQAAVARHLEQYAIHLAAEHAYHYVWHTVADKVIEATKPRLKAVDGATYDARDAASAARMLERVLETCLIMLHPFMPFVTEAIYNELHPDALLMIAPWTSTDEVDDQAAV